MVAKIELLLRSSLVKDLLSVVLAGAGFLVLLTPHPHDDSSTVIIDFQDCKEPEIVRAHQQRGARIVGLATAADRLEMDRAQIAPLSGILTDSLSLDAFVQALHDICAGGRIFPRELALRPKNQAPASDSASVGEHLSLREGEVLSHVVAGRSNKVIARRLGTTETTVRVHLNSLFGKIKVDNRTQAAVWAAANLPDLNPPLPGFV